MKKYETNNQMLNSQCLSYNPVNAKIDSMIKDENGDLKKFVFKKEKNGIVQKDNGDIEINFYAPNAEKVEVAGFGGLAMGGQRRKLKSVGDGYWSVTISNEELPVGFHYHEYFVDGNRVVNQLAPIGYGAYHPVNFLEKADESCEFYMLQDVPHGTVHMELYQSSAAEETRTCYVYTPPGYESKDKNYPVLYLQHGSGENETGWVWQGKINYIMDNLLAQKQAEEMIIVMNSGYNIKEKEELILPGDFDSVLVKDCIPFIEDKYRVLTDRESRAIAGLSMGSSQALQIAFYHQDMFAWLGMFSGKLNLPEALDTGIDFDYRTRFESPEEFNKLMNLFFVSCGEQEAFFDSIKNELAKLKEEKGIESEFYSCPGYHEWTVWRKCAYEFLQKLFK